MHALFHMLFAICRKLCRNNLSSVFFVRMTIRLYALFKFGGGNMIKIAICDDEQIFLNDLRNKICDICKNEKIEFSTDSYTDGYSLLENQNKYHIIFLDIDMPMLNGLSVAENININKKNNELPFLVFVSSNDHLVFDALRNYPFSFIRKSNLNSELKECILKIKNKLNFFSRSYTIHTGREDIVVEVKDTIFLEKEKNYVVFHLVNNDYIVRSNINTEYERLSDFGFIRPHIGYLVNCSFVKSISANKIQLTNGELIPISKKFSSVKEDYFKWLGDNYA